MPLLSIRLSLVKALANNVAYPEPPTLFISAAGRRGRVAPSVCDIIDTRQEQGGSRDGVGRLSAEPEPFPTELLGCGGSSQALSIEDQTDHESKRYRREEQPAPMKEGVEDGHALPSLKAPPAKSEVASGAETRSSTTSRQERGKRAQVSPMSANCG
jgi:hypothetical protein